MTRPRYNPRYAPVQSTCTECGNLTLCVATDLGIGLTEAWGYVQRHTEIYPLSQCCEAPCTHLDSDTHVTLKDLEEEARGGY